MGSGLGKGIVGDMILMGSPWHRFDGAQDVGSVFLFDISTGEYLRRIDNPNPESAEETPQSSYLPDWFGWSVAGLGGDCVIVGANEDDPDGVEDAGSVYVFSAATGDLLLSIPNPDRHRLGEINAEFGRSVAAVGGNILTGGSGSVLGEIPPPGHLIPIPTGAEGNDADNIPDTGGVAYLFDGDTGELILRIPNPEPERFDAFGHVVASMGSDLLIAAPNDSFEDVLGSGSVYLFEGPRPAIDGDFIGALPACRRR
jgi:hypothetical protein